MRSVPIHHTSDPDTVMQHFDGAYRLPLPEELESFAAEYAAVHASFTERASDFFGGTDRDGVTISPSLFAASRKIGLVLDDSTFQDVSLTRWLSEFVAELAQDYMVTVDAYCDHGQAFLCFTRCAIWTFGDPRDLRILGLEGAAFPPDL